MVRWTRKWQVPVEALRHDVGAEPITVTPHVIFLNWSSHWAADPIESNGMLKACMDRGPQYTQLGICTLAWLSSALQIQWGIALDTVGSIECQGVCVVERMFESKGMHWLLS